MKDFNSTDNNFTLNIVNMTIKVSSNSNTENIFKNTTFNNTLNNTNSTSDNTGCELLGEFGYIIQGILGLMCFAVLICT